MARSTPITLNFNGGEIAPAWAARADLRRFGSSLEVMQNFIPQIQGPALRRSGTRHVGEIKTSSNKGRLIPFVVSDIQGYVIEAGNQYFRFYRDEERLDNPPGTAVEIATPYLTADLFDLHFAQSADVLYIAHKSYAPRKLERLTATSFQLSTVDFFDGPYEAENIDGTLILTPSNYAAGPPPTIRITASSALFEIGRDEGRLIRIRNDGGSSDYGWGAVQITSVTSTTVVECEVIRTLKSNTDATTQWRLGSWYVGNYPRSVSFHGERLIFSSDEANPQTFYGSVAGDFEAFIPSGNLDRKDTIYQTGDPGDDVTDANAYAYQLGSNKVNVITWVTSLRTLIFGTLGGIWPAQASKELEAITPLNITVQNSSTKGASSLQPATIEDSFFYVSRTKRKAFLVAFRIESESYKPEDISLLASHLLLLGGGITEIDYANEPNSTVWMVRSDGRLIGLTVELEQKVTGWHQHIPGGSFDGGDAVVESIAVIPATEGSVTTDAHENIGHDQLWMIVKRTIDGNTVRYVEFMEDDWRDDVDAEDAFFVDSGISGSGAATDTITGLDHLEGETVSILGDGSKMPTEVVSGGQITVDRDIEKWQVGLGYTSRLKTLPLAAPDPQGSSRGKLKNQDHLTLVFHRSLGGQITEDQDEDTFEELVLSSIGTPLGDPPELFSGDYTHALECGWDQLAQVEIRQTDPYPMMLMAIVHHVSSSQRGSE